MKHGSRSEYEIKPIITPTAALGGQTNGGTMTSSLLVVMWGVILRHATTVVLIHQSIL
jgi:hypothetical protein